MPSSIIFPFRAKKMEEKKSGCVLLSFNLLTEYSLLLLCWCQIAKKWFRNCLSEEIKQKEHIFCPCTPSLLHAFIYTWYNSMYLYIYMHIFVDPSRKNKSTSHAASSDFYCWQWRKKALWFAGTVDLDPCLVAFQHERSQTILCHWWCHRHKCRRWEEVVYSIQKSTVQARPASFFQLLTWYVAIFCFLFLF